MTGAGHPDGSAASRPDGSDQVTALFEETFGGAPTGYWWAPGRVNLIGEHTDYNDGYVLPFALVLGIVAAVRVSATPTLRARSRQEDGVAEALLAAITPQSVDGWFAYAAGVAWAFRQRGHEIPGLDIALDSNLPTGAGLSSSAALECAVAVAWNDLGRLDLSRHELANIARSAENDVVGAPTGAMDQMASLYGRDDHLVFLDTRSMAVRHVPFDLAAAGLALLVIDSRTPHALVASEYAERRRTCSMAAALLGVPALRDIAVEDLDDALGRLDDELMRKRVRHVVTENQRVLETVATLQAGQDPRRIGPILTASHSSMRDDFTLTVPQVDLAVTASLDAGAYGARMTGGGFGGSVLAIVDAGQTARIAEAVEAAYASAGYRPPSVFTATASAGAHRL
jgi:galactokinase